ncbi:helix-turn-helix domain-containing protein [Paraburkholderia caribensis]|uniref:helix-turn-helix domain-containing protein n=1 Tax=Paraburkholderia TaxID=1822464 RepID=UPI001CACE29C|nr:hypothetical protein PCAR4_570126 [Paraburkholderia caribensis]
MAIRLPVGEIIREWREQRGLTQVGLAEASGLSSQYISRLEIGRNPSLETLAAIAEVLDCKVSELIAAAEERASQRE